VTSPTATETSSKASSPSICATGRSIGNTTIDVSRHLLTYSSLLIFFSSITPSPGLSSTPLRTSGFQEVSLSHPLPLGNLNHTSLLLVVSWWSLFPQHSPTQHLRSRETSPKLA
jgi:hypothetical protein